MDVFCNQVENECTTPNQCIPAASILKRIITILTLPRQADDLPFT